MSLCIFFVLYGYIFFYCNEQNVKESEKHEFVNIITV